MNTTRTIITAASMALGALIAFLAIPAETLAETGAPASAAAGMLEPQANEQGVFAGEGYEVSVTDVTGPVGAEREVQVRVTAGPGYKFNAEFPSKLLVTAADGFAVAKEKLGRADGAFDGDSFVFILRASPQHAGDHELHATLRFSVCNDASCLVDKRDLVAKVIGE